MMRDRLLPGLLALACLSAALPAAAETRLEGLEPFAIRHCVEPVPFELWRDADLRGGADRRPACAPEALEDRPGKWVSAPRPTVEVPKGLHPTIDR